MLKLKNALRKFLLDITKAVTIINYIFSYLYILLKNTNLRNELLISSLYNLLSSF